MASKKGIAITAVIVAGIVGASVLVWMMPASGPTRIDAPMTDVEIISDIYSRHIDLAESVQSDFSGWKNGTVSTQQMLSRIDSALADTDQIQRDIQRKPAQDWVQSYDLYARSLDSFEEYLKEMQSVVRAADLTSPHEKLDALKKEWQDYVEQSVASMPGNKSVTSGS